MRQDRVVVHLPRVADTGWDPGPVSKAHHDLEGSLECAKCHVFGSGSLPFRCLDCHQEIAHCLAEKRGYHATQVKPQTGLVQDEHRGGEAG